MPDTSFPQNIVDTLAAHLGGTWELPTPHDPLGGLGTDTNGNPCIFKRPVEVEYPNGSLGIFATNWAPLDWEIGASETRGRYNVYLQTLHKHSSREEGASISSKCVKTLRVMLYRDADLRVALGNLSETILGVRERPVRWGVQEQRYQDNVLRGEFLFVSATHFWLETEING